jgi:uncharacterized protein
MDAASSALAVSPELATAAAAVVVGFSASFHCFVMCGPLACASCAAAEGPRWMRICAYQGARVLSYALVGGLLGALGAGVGLLLTVQLAQIAPWLLVVTLLASALDLGQRLPPIRGLTQFVRRAGSVAQRFPPVARAFTLGAITPLLPCGLLYGVFAASVATGTFAGGALALGAFGLGAIPALLVAQVPSRLTAGTGRVSLFARRALPVIAATFIAYRALFVHPAAHCH